MLFKYFLLWFPMVLIAIINGTIREGFYITFLEKLQAHQLSVISGIIFFTLYVRFITGRWKIISAKQSVTIGSMWLVMTVLFEFVFGHYVMGNSWQKLLYDYNIAEGRLWIIVLIWLFFLPLVFYKLQKKRI